MTAPKDTPLLLFFTDQRSGPARRMESLLAHLARKERDRMRVSLVEAEKSPELMTALNVTEIPTLVLIKNRETVARLEGRASAPQIEKLLAPHLDRRGAAQVAA